MPDGKIDATSQSVRSEPINYRPPGELTPYENNARTHSEEQIGQIMASIRAFGFTAPVLLHHEVGILAGHGRAAAAIRLGLAEVPTISLDHLSLEEARAYVIADNQLAQNAGWDFEMLAIEIGELKGIDFDLGLLGFDPVELREILGDEPALSGMPELPEGDRPPLQQMAFIVADDQAETIKAALSKAKKIGGFEDSPNENSNGNALALICRSFLDGS